MKPVAAVSTFEMGLLRSWLLITALVELPQIWGYLIRDCSFKGSFFSTVKNERAEKRLWSTVLALLVLTRVQALMYTRSKGVMMHCAAVHVLEAVVLVGEYLLKGSEGNPVIASIIVANAVWFSRVAAKLIGGSRSIREGAAA